jgi:hypothetical protein
VSPWLEPVDLSLAGITRADAPVYRHTGLFDGTELTVVYLLSEPEHHMRLRTNTGGVENERLLAALLSLPTTALAPLERRFEKVFEDPATSNFATILEDPDGRRWGQRRLGVPIEVLRIEARAKNWTRASAVAHEWVGYAARVVHLDEVPTKLESVLLMEAAFYGIGVTVGGEKLLEPCAYRPQRWTSARWRFAEQIYSQFRTLSSALV